MSSVTVVMVIEMLVLVMFWVVWKVIFSVMRWMSDSMNSVVYVLCCLLFVMVWLRNSMFYRMWFENGLFGFGVLGRLLLGTMLLRWFCAMICARSRCIATFCRIVCCSRCLGASVCLACASRCCVICAGMCIWVLSRVMTFVVASCW